MKPGISYNPQSKPPGTYFLPIQSQPLKVYVTSQTSDMVCGTSIQHMILCENASYSSHNILPLAHKGKEPPHSIKCIQVPEHLQY